MEFCEDFEEIVEVFNTYIFDAKVINNEAELDGMPFVGPEVWSQGHFVETLATRQEQRRLSARVPTCQRP
jgi:hypothetical protein